MKFLHLADLHLGKTLSGFSLLEDQRYILDQILALAEEKQVQALLLSGDIYDKTTPSGEAMMLFDDFLTQLSNRNIVVLAISGNHDSPERLSFAGEILARQGVYLAGGYQGALTRVDLEDAYGPIHVYLMPFLRPAHVKRYLKGDGIESYQDAVEAVLAETVIDPKARNLLVAHQFFVGVGEEPDRSDSEIGPVGGLDSVGAGILSDFDYVALGHLHKPQQLGRETLRYGGSPLKYSVSEAGHMKSVPLVEFREKGNVIVQLLPLTPLRELRCITGPLEELIKPSLVSLENPEDYIQVTLTDEEECYDVVGKLRQAYPNLLGIRFDNTRSRAVEDFEEEVIPEEKSAFDLFCEFYQMRNGRELEQEDATLVKQILEEVQGER